MPRFPRLLAVTALFGGLALAAGCSSTDRHVFESPLTHPVTVSVIDSATEKPLWRMPVPPGEKLIVNLDRDTNMGGTTAEAVPATSLSWELYHEQAVTISRGYPLGSALKSGKIKLPGTPIRLDLVYTKPNEQPKPILPSQQTAAAQPAQETTASPAQENTLQPAAQGEPTQETTQQPATQENTSEMSTPPAASEQESTAQPQEDQSPTMNSDEGDAAPAQTQPQPEQTTQPAQGISPETTAQPSTQQPDQSNDQIMFK